MLFDDSTRVWCDEMGVVQVVKERGYGADVRVGVERGTGEGERGRSKSILDLFVFYSTVFRNFDFKQGFD